LDSGVDLVIDPFYDQQFVSAMVLRDKGDHEDFYLKVGERWILVDEQLLRSHPGGSAILTYKNLDATTVFHTFHANSKLAYKMLGEVLKEQPKHEGPPLLEKIQNGTLDSGIESVNMGTYDLTPEESARMCKNFETFRVRVRNAGLLDASHIVFARKFVEALALLSLAVYLQSKEYFVISALIMGLAWQQLGWMIHEYTHHQHFKTHFWNDWMSYIVGNLLQGFSSSGWKEQHNVHHAATNVDGRDGDLDLLPFWATLSTQLNLIERDSLFFKLIPFQHMYWNVALPLLRLSWLTQSVIFVATMNSNFYDVYRERALVEQISLALHWIFIVLQYYCMPDFETRIMYFLISQLFAGFLIAHVVTYNHYSCIKFPYDARIMENYACLQLYTTRNMTSGIFIDWFWGGLNYQIEHHLFPTMPRHNLKKVMPLVKEFCKENNLPYMVDDYATGFWLTIEQFRNIASVASKIVNKKSSE
jgi:fatty acid desaturase